MPTLDEWLDFWILPQQAYPAPSIGMIRWSRRPPFMIETIMPLTDSPFPDSLFGPQWKCRLARAD
jgi:hypothetical protein